MTKLFDVDGKPDQFVFSQISNGAIIEIVRPNWRLTEKIGTNLHVSHLGFVFTGINNDIVFRHASSDKGKVVEVSLIDYLRNCLSSKTIQGINVLVPIEKAIMQHK